MYAPEKYKDQAQQVEEDKAAGYYPKGSSSTKTCVLELRYYANGGDGDPPPTNTQTFVGKKTETVTFTDTVKDNVNFMVKEGYWFYGWATSSDGSVAYYPGNEITKTWEGTEYGSKKYKLYAKWRTDKLIVYHPDEHSNESLYVTDAKASGAYSTLRRETFHRTGYTQTGWSTEEGGPKAYDLGYNLSFSDNAVFELWPFWSPNTYNITFHANGGVGDDYTIQAVYDADVTLPSLQTIGYTKTGYHISGWNEEPDGSESNWYSEWTYTFNRAENVELYAIWVGDEYTVYYTDGTANQNNVIHTSKAIYGSPFYTDRVPYPADKVYCSFDGWLADDNTILTKQNAHFDAYSYGQDPTWLLQRDLTISPRWSTNYPFGKMFFAGQFSDDCGIYVEEPPSYSWPEYIYSHHEAYGKNGDILVDGKRFKNVKRKYKISAYDYSDYYSVAKKVSSWLHSQRSNRYLRLEDSYEPDVYRMAVYEESNELENILATAGKCEIEFNCKPQKFLHSGDIPINITQSGQVIVNPTNHASSPLIKIYGVGKIYINDAEIEVIKSFNNVTFDADTYNAFDASGRSMNWYVHTEDIIELKPGNNVITVEGDIFNLSITPRWWIV